MTTSVHELLITKGRTKRILFGVLPFNHSTHVLTLVAEHSG
jgi:hypothetical protein